MSTLDNLFNLSEDVDSVEHNGQYLSIKWFNGVHSRQTNYQSRYALINQKIFIVVSQGTPSHLDIKTAGKQLKNIHDKNGLINIDIVWDSSRVKNPSIRIRKGIIQLNNELSKYWRNKYVIVSPKHKTLIRIYRFLYQKKVENLYFSDSISSAIDAILAKKQSDLVNDLRYDDQGYARETLLNKSKEELVDLIELYQKSNRESTEKVLEAIGHISWEGNYQKVDINVNEDDLHFELVNAFSILQQDLGEIIKEYRELNQNLELKVAERIVDFIDKESNLRSILDNSDRITWLLNSRLELIDFNVAFSDEFKKRYNNTPKINHKFLDLLSTDGERETWRERFEAALKGKPGIYLDQDNSDGYDRVWEIKTFPITEIGKIKGISVFVEDITVLKENQFKLIEKNKDLQKVNNELDSFVYRVSHDLRAPLTSILGLISLMKIETDHEKLNEYINLQESSIQKLDLFIKEIINLSRNSRLGITVGKIDFKSLLDDIFESQSFIKIAEQTEKIYEIEKGLEFYTDRQRLSIILNNLISNSLKYAKPNDSNSFVKIKAYEKDDNCVIEVSDNGIGISEIYLPKIFEMFFRATHEFSGSGLGLYIVKETVEKLKGQITVKSKMREGTTVKLSIPNLKGRYDSAPKLDD